MLKKLFLLAFVFLFISTAYINAQNRLQQLKAYQEKVEKQIKTLKDTLSLTDDQTKKVTVIIKDNNKELISIVQKGRRSDDKTEMKKAVLNNLIDLDKKIESVLTDQQKEKYAKYKKAKMEERIKEYIGNN